MALGTPTTLTGGGSATTDGSITTASVSPTGGALLMMSIGCRGALLATFTISDTFTGTGAWTQLYIGAGTTAHALFYAKAGATPGSGTVTITYSSNQVRSAWTLDQITGQDTTTPVPQNNTGSSTVDTLSISLGSALASGSKSYGTCSTRAAASIGPGGAETEIQEQNSTGASPTYANSQWYTTQTISWATLGTTANRGVVIEIAEAAAAAGGWGQLMAFDRNVLVQTA